MLTERMMRRAIYDAFVAEIGTDLNPNFFTEPWRSIFLIGERNDRLPLRGASPLTMAINTVADDADHARELMRQIEAANDPQHFPTLAEIAKDLPPVSWLWTDWIPRGMLSLLGAYQGGGKSYFVLDLARTVIAGETWPDGSEKAKAGTVIYVDAEAIPQVNNERAEKLGVDRDKLYLVMADNGQLLDLTQRTWQDLLIEMVADLEPDLVIIDSLTSISSVGQNSVEDTNRLLMFLVGLANFGQCGMLVLHHLRKPPGGQMTLPGISIHDFRGSSHITAMARTVLDLSVVQKPGKAFSLNGPRRVEIAKTNLGPYPEPLGLTLIEQDGRAVFEYGEAPAVESRETKSNDCESWLIAYLEEAGASKPSDVVADAEEEGFNQRMVYRARKALGDRIRNTAGYRSPKNQWILDDDDEYSDNTDNTDKHSETLTE